MFEIQIRDLDLDKIARSGQCFRMKPLDQEGYEVTARGNYVKIVQRGDEFLFSCREEEFYSIWKDYFDLDTDYDDIRRSVDPQDAYLLAAMECGRGVRILKQDLWEMIITFIVSQNNNISRIRNSIEALCERYGSCLHPEGMTDTACYLFPSADAIAKGGLEGLNGLGLGYRDKYILELARKCSSQYLELQWLEELKQADYETAYKLLLSEYGIGKKVADCICLFGLHHVGAFPIDTHIRQILKLYYPNGFPLERYQGYAGILQQYMFYYKLNGSK